ncbi:MAG: hypothetical protein BGO77_02345 [Caedibacter sp. 37-49]|nr:MAG: hypothetical protein BGO77_02345 [Caedibacter sp. 37-49]
MKLFNKLFYVVLCISLCIFVKSYACVSGYTLEGLQADKNVLKTIATKIVSEVENIEFIKNELRRKHGSEAYALWSKYNQDNLPDVESLKKLNLSKDITQGKTIDANFRKNSLRPLVGKSLFTLFKEETIKQIENYLHEAIQKGNIHLSVNKMLAEQAKEDDLRPDSLEIKYRLSIPLAEVFEKEKISPPKIKSLGLKDNIIIIMFAKDFIDALLADKHSLENPKLQGRINSVYLE